jgi:hypothetical protein
VEQSTDIVITLNVPHIPGETQREAEVSGGEEGSEKSETAVRMKEAWEGVVGSLEVRDWGLFGGE